MLYLGLLLFSPATRWQFPGHPQYSKKLYKIGPVEAMKCICFTLNTKLVHMNNISGYSDEAIK
jgi:hypothetical protein